MSTLLPFLTYVSQETLFTARTSADELMEAVCRFQDWINTRIKQHFSKSGLSCISSQVSECRRRAKESLTREVLVAIEFARKGADPPVLVPYREQMFASAHEAVLAISDPVEMFCREARALPFRSRLAWGNAIDELERKCSLPTFLFWFDYPAIKTRIAQEWASAASTLDTAQSRATATEFPAGVLAMDDRGWSHIRSPKEWGRLFQYSVGTLKRWIDEGRLHRHVVNSKKWRLRLKDLPENVLEKLTASEREAHISQH